MNDLIMRENETLINQTPIEIALGIDEEGRTTARNLYDYLELEKSQFARWAKTNIENNEFYEENKDWIGFDIMANGNKCKDYKLTTDFAKHLSMLSRSSKGKIARDYFVNVEEGTKKLAKGISDLSSELKYMIRLELNQKEQAAELKHMDSRVDHLEDTMTIDYSQQLELRNLAKNVVLDVIGGKHSPAYTYQYPKQGENDKPPKLYGTVISRIWHDYQDYFGINSYKNTSVARFGEAKVYLNNWKPPINMQLEIGKINRGEI